MVGRKTKQRQIVKYSFNARAHGKGLLQGLLAIVIVVIGVVAAIFFIKLRKPPQRIEQEALAPLVEVKQLRIQDIPMVVRGYGTVSPQIEVELVPEVGGKVISVHQQLKAGGFIRANEQILLIDPRDYELAVQQAEAAVAEARVRVDTELAEADVARREWQELHPDTEPASPLVLRQPQIRQAQALLESAKAQLATTKLTLERTSLSLPFDSLIASEKVDIGQYVVPGQSLGVAYGVDVFEVEVPLEDKELQWFDAFGASGLGGENARAGQKVPAKVRASFAGTEHIWQGYVSRTTGQVDKTSRLVPVVIEIPKPMHSSGERPPLLPGTFVEVEIEGRVLANAVAIPRDAVRQGNELWLVNDGRLHISSPKIVRADKDFAYFVSGVKNGALLVVSTLEAPIDGMKVRTQSELADANQTNPIGAEQQTAEAD